MANMEPLENNNIKIIDNNMIFKDENGLETNLSLSDINRNHSPKKFWRLVKIDPAQSISAGATIKLNNLHLREYDTNGDTTCFNPITNEFTVPEDGIYEIYLNGSVTFSAELLSFTIRIDNATYNKSTFNDINVVTTGYIQQNKTERVFLKAGQKITFWLYSYKAGSIGRERFNVSIMFTGKKGSL